MKQSEVKTPKLWVDLCNSNVIFYSYIKQVVPPTNNMKNINAHEWKEQGRRYNHNIIYRILEENMRSTTLLGNDIVEAFRSRKQGVAHL